MSTLLSSIEPGHSVVVSSIHDSVLKPKMMEMGILKGKELEVLFKAPFGDPIAIDIQGFVLSLRLEEAALIEVDEKVTTEVFA